MKKEKKGKLQGTEEVSFYHSEKLLQSHVNLGLWTPQNSFFFVFHLIDEERLYSI